MYVCMVVNCKVGPYGDWLNFPYDVPVHLVAEPDCCRIITCNGCEILQVRVSETYSLYVCMYACMYLFFILCPYFVPVVMVEFYY